MTTNLQAVSLFTIQAGVTGEEGGLLAGFTGAGMQGTPAAASAHTGNHRLPLGDSCRATGSGCSEPAGGASPAMRGRLTRASTNLINSSTAATHHIRQADDEADAVDLMI